MKRTEIVYDHLPDITLKKAMLLWGKDHEEVVFLDSNAYTQRHGEFEAVLAVDALTAIRTDHSNAFENLSEYRRSTSDWIFGYLTYDLKNDVENLVSENYDGLGFPDLYFFQPKKIIFCRDQKLVFSYLPMVDDEIEEDYEKIMRLLEAEVPQDPHRVAIKMRIHKDEYKEKVGEMLRHIHRGDIYEANFCQEFYAEDTVIYPLQCYFDLNAISAPPFATYLKLEELYLVSASPERYLKKKGQKVISQPIKGTARRAEDPEEDQQLAANLKADEKERSENVMIVDLVRNDLSRMALKGSVEVEELCEVYTFKQVHQLISTVTAVVSEDTDPVEIIRNTFPMGSMTGAPKISAMKIIEELEETRRGLYSGAVGYFSPEGDFDLNVIIRSILYNKEKRYVSFSVGSAITAASSPDKEYEECLVKAKAMREVLEGSSE
ncbi:aminodeoxychorismate synthase component I [Robertkochia sediminum]|uniref:aminodeoxychorismate synthase component I n=1 Tax=Robertkochia sediminum TaxID=2785326 RepID=UPI0019337738|nr:aminodeoxychorismate synthase component I [Robertkochia sediminum]MBL7473354.1 aminodeoxychorismate synthase component I [Robertkochia sediminum]